MKNRKKFITLLLLPLFGLIVAFSYYYFNHTLTKMKNQSETLLIIQDLKLLNHEIENIYNLKLNYLNYDKIVEKLSIFEKKLSILQNDEKLSLILLKDVEINKQLLNLTKLYPDRKANVEKYKSISAIVNNSIRYIFDLHSNLLELSLEKKEERLNDVVKTTTKIISLFTFANFDKELNTKKLANIVKGIKNSCGESEEGYEVIEFLKLHSNLIIKNAKVIQEIYKRDRELNMKDNIDELYQALIKYFSDNSIWQEVIINILFVLVLILFIIAIIIFIKEEKLKRELHKLNLSLEEKVKGEIKKQKEKDEIIFQQAKITAMGEMAKNIAHQWRQPLNAVALIIQDIYGAYEDGELDLDYIKNSERDAMKQITFMSKTIDNFRNLFQSSDGLRHFDLKSTIEDSIKFIDATLEHYNIRVKKELLENIVVTGFQDEFSQVVVNLLSNAKDTLIENKILNPILDIAMSIEDENVIVKFKDNAGGIEKSVIDRIFEPYFTTKEQGKGIGMGLYMSKIIIEKNMGGELFVTNELEGAVFTIILPMNK